MVSVGSFRIQTCRGRVLGLEDAIEEDEVVLVGLEGRAAKICLRVFVTSRSAFGQGLLSRNEAGESNFRICSWDDGSRSSGQSSSLYPLCPLSFHHSPPRRSNEVDVASME